MGKKLIIFRAIYRILTLKNVKKVAYQFYFDRP